VGEIADVTRIKVGSPELEMTVPSRTLRRVEACRILSVVTDELLAAYRNTRYCVRDGDGLERCLKIRERAEWLDRMLSERGLRSAVFITAENPGSRVLNAAENRHRTEALRDRLLSGGHEFVDGYGEGIDPGWVPEQSFLVLGMSLAEGEILARRFGQLAYVFVQIFRTPELIITGESTYQNGTYSAFS
jgi:hypothetical protein